MRIAIVGYGKMGKLIEEVAVKEGHQIAYRISSANKELLGNLSQVDVAIEFTNPESAIENFEVLAAQGIPIVTGSTGWHGRMDWVKELVRNQNIPFFHASNFSLGVHITIAAANYLTKLVSNHHEYSGSVEEWHHIHKKDSPSGTAITIAEEILKHHPHYRKIGLEPKTADKNALPIIAHREGEIFGTHEVKYTSDIDSISIRHTAKSRLGFAQGALMAAGFIQNSAPGIYNMNHLIKLPI